MSSPEDAYGTTGMRFAIIRELDGMVSEFILPNEYGGYDVDYGQLADVVLPVVTAEQDQLRAERDAHVHTLDHVLEELHTALGGLPEDANLATFPGALEQVVHLREELRQADERNAATVNAAFDDREHLLSQIDELRHESSLQLAGKRDAEREVAHLAEQQTRAARHLDNLPATYTVGPGNALHVLNLVYADIARISEALRGDSNG